VERVIFTFIVRLPSFLGPFLQEITEALLRKLQGSLRGLLRALLERVEDEDRLRELGEVENAVLEPRVYSDLTHAKSDGRKRLPIVRLKSTLNSPELKPRDLSRVGREPPDVVLGSSEPDHGLLSHVRVYNYSYIGSTRRGSSPNITLERTGLGVLLRVEISAPAAQRER
jgi:hypothetical protein